jgi:site-specific recombinase XerD
VFLALSWPYEPLSHMRVGNLVIQSLRRAGIKSVSARNLRASVVTHLLRQGQPLSTIQQVVGHGGKCATDTTQRYAAIDTQLLRRVLDKEER